MRMAAEGTLAAAGPEAAEARVAAQQVQLDRVTGQRLDQPVELRGFADQRGAELGLAGQEAAPRAVALGLYVSFSGILTFKRSEELRAVAATVPLDRLLVETDSPYLAPNKYRGKRNEPAYVVYTAAELARVKGVSAEEIAAITTDNFFRLYDKTPRAAFQS